MSNSRNNGNEGFITKLLLAGAGILGVAAGAGATYLGSNDLQESQFAHAEALAVAEAQGAARVLQTQVFRSADNLFAASLRDCKYAAGIGDLETTIPYSDQRVLASRLDPDEWEDVAFGLERLNHQVDKSLVEDFTAEFAVPQIQELRDAMRKAQQALERLAGTDASELGAQEPGCA